MPPCCELAANRPIDCGTRPVRSANRTTIGACRPCSSAVDRDGINVLSECTTKSGAWGHDGMAVASATPTGNVVIRRKRREVVDIGERLVRQRPTSRKVRLLARRARVIGGKKAWSTVAIVQLV